MKVYIDPAADMLYASFYIKGLEEVFGKRNIGYSAQYFKNFVHNNHFFAFVLVDDNKTMKKLVVDFTDAALIDEKALDWADVYGKVNYDGQYKSEKILVIGPSFGINIYSGMTTAVLAVSNFLKAYPRIPDKRRFLSDYKSQFRRPQLQEYNKRKNNGAYIFFMASLWKNEKQTNQFRANFIRACRANPNIKFEGGFAPRTKRDLSGFEALTTPARVKMDYYMSKILQSILVFNTPAVKDCHGWKLGEYLCMGTVILSTPLKRQLPQPLLDGEHVIFTDGSESDITKKVNTLLKNDSLREKLENNTAEYYQKYLQPKQAIRNLLGNAIGDFDKCKV
ncbi:glycosyltransferase [Mangrovimonas sp. YM274]|uniref:glycosyltransferase n=1 Tax=Mangrovimonas sp. YM274 TaxID=3070660 RepID=UPI0027DDEBF6|nr:glycosyltransferase [Mangrovimonas sp. YM274]WMI69834.1 glycosyltransferase [Mangrovimonas sp. YM274]